MLAACAGDLGDGPGSGGELGKADGLDRSTLLLVRPSDAGEVGIPLYAEPSNQSRQLTRMPAYALLEALEEPEGRWRLVSYFHPGREEEIIGWAVNEKLKSARDDNVPPSGHTLLLPWPAGRRYKVNVAPHRPMHHKGNSRFAYDFDLNVGAVVVAAHTGRVKRLHAGSRSGACDPSYASLANYVALNRGDGVETLYVHLGKVAVKKGQLVKRGERIGTVGLTGYVCGSHLHFQVQKPGPDNDSIARGRFWDTGLPLEPRVGSKPLSQNRRGSLLP